MPKYTLTEGFHSVKKKPIWLVKPNDKLEYADYKKLEGKIKIIGGYYSRFSRSFVFETEPKIEKLNEAFGDTSTTAEKAKEMGVSENKLALIDLKSSGFSTIDKRTLKKEYDAKKLLVAKTSFFDGMMDMSRSIPENEWQWSDKDYGFEKEFDYSRNPYVSGSVIKLGDYKAKYKDDIVQPVKERSSNQSSLNYFVDVENDSKVNKENQYKLDRIDSDSKDHEKGDRVVLSIYGNKYCGYISDKRINTYTIRTFSFGQDPKGTGEVREDVSYKVTLDNGVTSINGNL